MIENPKYIFLKSVILLLIVPFTSCSQQSIEHSPRDTVKTDTVQYNSIYNPTYYQKFHNKWIELEDGLQYIEKMRQEKIKLAIPRSAS